MKNKTPDPILFGSIFAHGVGGVERAGAGRWRQGGGGVWGWGERLPVSFQPYDSLCALSAWSASSPTLPILPRFHGANPCRTDWYRPLKSYVFAAFFNGLLSVEVALLAIFLVVPAVAELFQETKAGPEVNPEKAKQKWSRTWHTWTYVSPHIPGMPKVIIDEKKKSFGGCPLLAIWSDGTIAWLDKTRKEQDAYFVSKISSREIDEAIQGVKKYTASSFPKRSQAVATRNCPMDDAGVGLVLLDTELFVTHLWSHEALHGREQVRKFLAESADRELVQYLRSRLERSVFDKPWHFLADYAGYVGMKNEDFFNGKSSDVLKKVAEHLIKDGDHFVFCRERIESLIPKLQSSSPLVSKPLSFSYHPMEGKVEQLDDAHKYVFSYCPRPTEVKKRVGDD